MAKTIFERDELAQEGALVLLRACLREPEAPRYIFDLLNLPKLQTWLLGYQLESDSGATVSWEEYRSVFHELAEKLEAKIDGRPFYPATVTYLGERFGLNEAERRVIWFAVLQEASSGLRYALNELEADITHRKDVAKIIASLIDQPVADVGHAIGESGSLTEIGLLNAPMSSYSPEDYLNVDYPIAAALRDGPASDELLKLFLHPAKPTALCIDDFPHMWDDFQHVTHYLQAVLQAQTRGVNVLMHGSPGTGKTEFAAVIAAHLDVPLYVVPDIYADSKPYSDKDSRLAAYRMAQRLLASTPTLIVFDDLEDGVLDWDAGWYSKRTSGKSAMNNLLDSNPVPAIWITNTAELMDPAHLRRFDYAIAFKTPPRSVRASLVDKGLHGLPLSTAFKAELADGRLLTPAQLNKIAKVVGHIAQAHQPISIVDDESDLDGLARHVYQATQKLRFQAEAGEPASRFNRLRFNPEFINASQPVDQIVDLFRCTPGLTGCFHGLPGSGKTALAEFIAWSLDKPLLIKRGSDLLRPYLGETELRLKGMFEEAMDEGALLLLDEADSFLTDRERAQRSWEVTQVNELLTQIERYHGHFIATTNAFDVLDPASLRRFDLKVRFAALQPEQRLRLLDALLMSFGLSEQALAHCRQEVQDILNGLPQLTPGDFAVVARRLNAAVQDVQVFTVVDALREEHQLKKPIARHAGFIH